MDYYSLSYIILSDHSLFLKLYILSLQNSNDSLSETSIIIWTLCEGNIFDGRTVYIIFHNSILKKNLKNKV